MVWIRAWITGVLAGVLERSTCFRVRDLDKRKKHSSDLVRERKFGIEMRESDCRFWDWAANCRSAMTCVSVILVGQPISNDRQETRWR